MPDGRLTAPEAAPILSVENLGVAFGGLVAVDAVSFVVEEGHVFGIIGPNGAGKTTLFNAVTGLVAPRSGRVLFRGRDVTRVPTWRRVRMGMARTFQNLRLFPELTVFQTVLVGRHARRRAGAAAHVLGVRRAREDEVQAREQAMEALAFVGMADQKDEPVRSLPYGHRRRVEIARALATDPALLLLDEPAAGMNPQECDDLVEIIRRIEARGITVVLVEHHMRVVMSVCDRIVVLNHGSKIAEGPPEEIRSDPRVVEAYLGKEKPRRARA